MNIKQQILLKRLKEQLGKIVQKPLAFLLTPVVKYEDKRREEKFNRIKEHNKNMTDAELMCRYAKHLIREMIRRDKEKVYFYVCNNRYKYDDLDDGFIVYDLRNLSKCKDKYLAAWYYTGCKYTLYDDNIMEVEKRLNSLLKVEVEKLGCKVEFIDERERMSEYWVKGSEYQKTMVISLP